MTTRERNMLIFLGVVAVAAGAFFFLTRGGGAPEEAAPTPTSPPPISPAPPAVTPTPGVPPDREPPPRAFGFFGGRDPFVPLVVAEEGGGGTEPAPPETPPPDGEEPPPDRNGGPTDGVVRGGEQVQVVDVFVRRGEPVVQVSVGADVFVVGEGETFARNFRVVAIDDPCATFLFGDERFTLCEPGEKK